MNLKKFNAVALAIFVLTFILVLAGTCTAMPVEIRGTPFDTGNTDAQNLSWDFRNFGAFFFKANKYGSFMNGSGEHLYFQDKGNNPAPGKDNPSANIIDKGELIYSTRPLPSKYKVFTEEANVTKVSSFYMLPLFGKSYCAIDNDAAHLAKMLFQQDENEKKTLREGESWDIAGGYSIILNGVDVEGNKCYFSVYRNNKEIDTAVVSMDGTIDDRIFTAEDEFGDNSSHVYFITFVDSVFAGEDANFAVFKYTWLIDKDKPLSIESGDKFGSFEVDQALENMVIMSNANSITINVDADSRTNITDEWYFVTSDERKGSNGGYLIYPAKTFVVEEQKPKTTEMNAGTAEMSASTSKPGNVQIQGENCTKTVATTENTNEKNEAIYKSSSETPAEDKAPSATSSAIPASSGFGGFLAIFSLASIVCCFKRG
jgi:S-layer protein (TIGR01567 family)